jgi:hypothetical protein
MQKQTNLSRQKVSDEEIRYLAGDDVVTTSVSTNGSWMPPTIPVCLKRPASIKKCANNVFFSFLLNLILDKHF